MNIDPQDWARLSALLDEVLELEPHQRDTWFEGLAAADQALSPTLRQLLAQQARIETHDALSAQPDFAGALLAESLRHRGHSSGLEPGSTLGAYRLIRELGHGGMGVVWLAERADGQMKRQVALKIPYAGPGQRELAERLARERDILASLEHPHIARLYDAGATSAGEPFLVLEYVDGTPITAWCDARALSLHARFTLFLQVVDAVQFAHARLVVHRDLKPSNILVTQDGIVRLLDFGIAKLILDGEARETALTQFGGRALTPAYASPEQMAGTPVTTASDVYALGVILYELATGSRPQRSGPEDIREPSRAGIDAQAASARASTPSQLARALRGDVDTVILKALAREPGSRYSSCEAFTRDLKALIDGAAIEARPATLAYRTGKFISRHRMPVAAGLIVAVSLVAGGGAALWQAQRARTNEARAIAEAKTANAVKQFMTEIFKTNTLSQKDPASARQATSLELLERGADRVAVDFKNDPALQRELMATILPMLGESRSGEYERHALEYAKLLEGTLGADLKISDIYNELSIQQSDPAKSRRLAEHGLEVLGPGDDDAHRLIRGKLLTCVGIAVLNTGDFDGAEKPLIQAREVLARSHVKTVEYGKVLSNLGWVALRRDQIDSAVKLFEEAMQAYESDPGVYERTLGLGRYDLAMARLVQSNYPGAERELRKAVDIFERSYGVDDVQTAFNTARLGSILTLQTRYADALALLEPAVRRLEKPSPQFNPGYLSGGVEYLADALVSGGSLEAAASVVERAVKLNEADAPIYQITPYLIAARLAAETGDTARADEFTTKALAAGVKAYGADSPKQSRFRAEAAGVLIEAGRLDRADELLALVLAADERRREEFNSPFTLATLRQARIQIERNQSAAALPTLVRLASAYEALPVERRSAGVEAELRLAMGKALLAQHRAKEAREHLQRLLSLQGSQLAGSPRLAEARLAMAECLLALGEEATARQLAAEARATLALHRRLNPRYPRELRALGRGVRRT